MSVWHMQPDLAASRRQHKQLYQVQGRYLLYVGLVALACLLYYVWFFLQFGISGEQLTTGLQQIGRYLARMFVWHDFWNWPFGYYFTQIGVTLAIVFAGTLTATVLALLLSFFAARNIMRGVVLGTLALLMRRLFDMLRGIDMAIWGLIFVRAVGLGPLAGVLAIIMQDTGLLGRLYAEGHEAVDRSPGRGLTAVGANGLQKHRFGIFTQSFPTFLALSLYQIESNTRSAAVLGFVGAGGIGLIYAENMRLWNWDVVMFITLLLVAVVYLLLVIGMMIGYICDAGTDFMITFAESSQLQNFTIWTMGSFSGMTWATLGASALITIPTVVLVFLLSKPLGAYLLGENYAKSMGVNVKGFRVALILLSSILSACVTAFAGPISFVGIAVPHITRLIFRTSRPMVLIPATFLTGSVFCLACDLIARTAFSPTELTISTVTSVLGAPVVIWLMIKRRRNG